MSRRQYSTITLSVTFDVPAGWTQLRILGVAKDWAVATFGQSAIVRLLARKVTYL